MKCGDCCLYTAVGSGDCCGLSIFTCIAAVCAKNCCGAPSAAYGVATGSLMTAGCCCVICSISGIAAACLGAISFPSSPSSSSYVRHSPPSYGTTSSSVQQPYHDQYGMPLDYYGNPTSGAPGNRDADVVATVGGMSFSRQPDGSVRNIFGTRLQDW